MEKYFDVLCKCPLFDGMDQAELSQLLGCLGARVMEAQKKQAVFTEGDPAEFVGIVLSGGVQVVRDDYYGRRSIVAAVGPAELFGEAFACAAVQELPVSVIAFQDSEILLLNCRRILTSCPNACAFHARLVGNLLRVVAGKNLLLNQKLDLVSRRTTREKLMAYLLAQAKKHGSNEFMIPYDRQSLADYLEVDRSAMSAEISRLRREGILETDRSWFRLLDARL